MDVGAAQMAASAAKLGPCAAVVAAADDAGVCRLVPVSFLAALPAALGEPLAAAAGVLAGVLALPLVTAFLVLPLVWGVVLTLPPLPSRTAAAVPLLATASTTATPASAPVPGVLAAAAGVATARAGAAPELLVASWSAAAAGPSCSCWSPDMEANQAASAAAAAALSSCSRSTRWCCCCCCALSACCPTLCMSTSAHVTSVCSCRESRLTYPALAAAGLS